MIFLGPISSLFFEYGVKNSVKEKTCFKNPNKPSCIDLFLTNTPKCFQNTKAIACGLSNCHKMILTVIKEALKKVKQKLNIIQIF